MTEKFKIPLWDLNYNSHQQLNVLPLSYDAPYKRLIVLYNWYAKGGNSVPWFPGLVLAAVQSTRIEGNLHLQNLCKRFLLNTC